MYYRLNVGTQDGLSRGYQWRELDLDTFAAIARGLRPLGDAESQSRDSTQVRADAENRPMYYLGVWHNGWVSDLTLEQAVELYSIAGQAQPGT